MYATGLVSLTLIIQYPFDPNFAHAHYLPYLPAIVAASVFTYGQPALFATLLVLLANSLFLDHNEWADAFARALLFSFAGVLIVAAGSRLRLFRERCHALSQQLGVRERLLQTVLDAVPVVILDRAGRIQSISGVACDMFQIEPDAQVGRPFSELVEDFDIEAAATGGRRADHAAAELHWIGRRADGETIPLEIQTGLLPDTGAPDAPHAVLCLTNLSRWYAADANANELRAQLTHIWRLNSLGEMAAILAHELNQPLTAATSYLHAAQPDLAKCGVFGDSVGRTLELAKGQILRAGQIIRRMKGLLTQGGPGLRGERASSMVEDLVPIVALLGEEAGARIRYEIDDKADAVLAERIQFQQAVVNLIRNAIEAVEGESRREVVVIGRPVSDSEFEVSVEDSGPGVAADQVERIFRPLTTTKKEGMGLGLSVSRTIIENHGGELSVRPSRLGGAAFFFNLKRDAENAKA